ncbi:asparagine synthase (glutamine-hydrolyzing) [Methyloversatilis sp. XJ19-13]|uniref:asparagine synthase (glutamine-hydrolyzing) n=1 Tax=Methyloversatilis sp. XJ19-13 TaxID=2963430 RepID=UPI00211CC364|nr:asparagine synthase (glutamine-hydrolyzing) [Methyloversatilis sp. XJ19-13]MCQ9373898.1 asparagine synthase (glutamine-hydrolyzing) [Methyloversatilis sp. XJ19-13]
MCGIAGALVTHSSDSSIDLVSLVERMVHAIHHRGPDNNGVHVKSGVGLGHARLSVIDLTEAGHQPMITSDDQVRLVFNGEIYNFKELRTELAREGYHFRSHTDTEVILNGYHRWGIEIFTRLRGMFAIAIWDGRSDELILARDRVGKKPLFYAWHEGVLLFGSEIKAILACERFSRKPDLEAIHHYLSLQYVPAPWSAFQGINKLPQASYMVVSRKGISSVKRYWQLPPPSEARHRPIQELQEELITLIDESVRLRMTSDVPLGAFLSGGVDSSAVVAMMARHSSGRIKTFCIGFDEAEYDERAYARIVAERYDTDHHEMVVRPNAVDILPKLIWHYNEPFADPSAVPTYYVSEIARRHVTVVLNGDGGDENFLGYSRYKQCLQTEWISRIPRALRRLSPQLTNSMPVCWERYRIPRITRRWLNYISEKDSRRYAPSIAYFHEQDKVAGYDENLTPYLSFSSLDILERYFSESPSYVGGAAWADIHTYLPDDLLVKVDIASMAHGLEARSPLLDHSLMEWAAQIPPSQKIVNGETKNILKSAMKPYLPHDVLYRPKMGFGVPIDRWLRAELKEFAYDTLLSLKASQRGLVKTSYVKNMLDEHCSGVRLHHTRLWALLILELWFQMWIDPTTAPLEPPSSFSRGG